MQTNIKIMEEKKLAEYVIKEIENDSILYGKIADAIGVKPLSMFRVLKNNSQKLQGKRAMAILRRHFKYDDDHPLFNQLFANS